MKVAEQSPTTSKGSSREYRPLGHTGIEDGDAPLHDERQSRL
jgi:hypothetical protein